MSNVIVVSAVNIVDGGPFTILRDCLDYIESSNIADNYECIALVNNAKQLKYSKIRLIEFPKAKRHYINRIYYEYFYFKKLAKQYKPYLWLSLHDMTPYVTNVPRVVTYMHNASPFNHISIKDLRNYSITYILFSLLYRWIYRINIHKNMYCVVQQQWLRDSFSRMFNINPAKIIVARPILSGKSMMISHNEFINKDHYIFFFPSYPRPFKNFEVICEAALILEKRNIKNFTVKLTIDALDFKSKYSQHIYNKYKHIKSIEFVGILDKNDMYRTYESTDCLIFPSKLETWGLPISEFMDYNRPMILADLPYAHETAAGANFVSFFDPYSAAQLADRMVDVINCNIGKFKIVPVMNLQKPKADSWAELFSVIL